MTIISTVTISHIGVKVSNTNRNLPIYSVETSEKKIAITFDAAWSAEDTDELIEILKKHNAKATIFAVGDWVEKNPEAVKKYGSIKETAARLFPDNIDKYIEYKSPCIEELYEMCGLK